MIPPAISPDIICPTPTAVCPRPERPSITLFISSFKSSPNMEDISLPNCLIAGENSVIAPPIVDMPWPSFLVSPLAFFISSIPFFISEKKDNQGDLPLTSSFSLFMASVISLILIVPFSRFAISLSVKPTDFKLIRDTDSSVPDIYLINNSYLSIIS